MQAIQFLMVSVDLLRRNTFNSNKVSAQNEEKIRESLRRNGMFKPIIVREVAGSLGYEIIGGEHRWEQAIELGELQVPIANLGEISDTKAKEISVIDNARYGADDTLMFADILKDIGSIEDIQNFLPYGDADLAAIFSASSIALADLEMPDEELDTTAPDLGPATKPTKTHTIMRFKASLGDAERLTALISATQKAQGLTTGDDLTNAGDAIVHLLSAQLAPAAATITPDDWDDILNDIENSRETDE